MEKNITELIEKAKIGERTAFPLLVEEYKPLILDSAKKYSEKNENVSVSFEDFVQEANLGFYSALMSYKTTDKVTFGLYAKICIKNRLISFLRKTNKKGKVGKENRNFKSCGAETEYFSEKDAENLISQAQKTLSKYEYEIFLLYLQRKKYDEIASEIGKTKKSVDNAMCRIRTKLKKIKTQNS